MDTRVRDWPAPYLQPERHTGCIEHSTAYLCRCLGYADVTADQIGAWRDNGHTDGKHYWEGMYPSLVLGHAKPQRFWQFYDSDEAEQRRFWLGPGTRPWVEQHLAAGHLALVQLHRIPTMAHAVVLLEARGDEGVFLMDPIYGHVVESWDWFLGIGPGNHGCHHVEGWYS